ncbi:MAG: hypothetical protein AAFU67_07545, partial [Bacteroidota bacterium]
MMKKRQTYSTGTSISDPPDTGNLLFCGFSSSPTPPVGAGDSCVGQRPSEHNLPIASTPFVDAVSYKLYLMKKMLLASLNRYVIGLALSLPLFLLSGSLVAQITITAQASCTDGTGAQAGANSYFVLVSSIVNDTAATQGNFDVTVDGVTQTFNGAAPADLYFGPFAHSVVGGAVQVITATDLLNTGAIDTEEVPELLCGITTDNGLNASGPFCMPSSDPSASTGAILVQSQPGTFMAGGTSGQVQTYVLVRDGFIVDANMSGLFTGLPS